MCFEYIDWWDKYTETSWWSKKKKPKNNGKTDGDYKH